MRDVPGAVAERWSHLLRGLRALTPSSEISQSLAWAVVLGCLAIAVKGRWLASMDLAVAQWVGMLQTPWRDQAARAVTFFGSSPWSLGVMAVMSVWWRRRRSWLAIFWGTWLLGISIQFFLRFWVAQWRPDTTMIPVGADLIARYELAGFTSGHAFRSSFLYGWWAGWFRRRRTSGSLWASVACLVLVVLVGFTRLSLNRHVLTDVVGAWVLVLFVLAVGRWLGGHRLEESNAS